MIVDSERERHGDLLGTHLRCRQPLLRVPHEVGITVVTHTGATRHESNGYDTRSIHGAAVGAGCSLALAAELRIASESARFGVVFSRIGLGPDAGASFFLRGLVGPAKALELLFLGELMDSSEALQQARVPRPLALPAVASTSFRVLCSTIAWECWYRGGTWRQAAAEARACPSSTTAAPAEVSRMEALRRGADSRRRTHPCARTPTHWPHPLPGRRPGSQPSDPAAPR